MVPSKTSSRRRQKATLCPEVLETRSLMTGGAGNTFALIPGTIDTPGGTATVPITIDTTHFTLPKGRLALGIDVVPEAGSTLQPLIQAVNNPHGTIVPQAFTSIYNPHLSHAAVGQGVGTRAVLAPLTLFPNQPNTPATYNITVTAQSKTSGNFLLGFYLPGDANGDGVVNQEDLALVRQSLNSRSGDVNYNFDADANRDGRIGKIDLAYTQQNQGVATTITPLVSANLDAADVSAAGSRITSKSTVHFSGKGTPGAAITFSEVTSKAPKVSTTADSQGNFNLMVPLGTGENTFQVTAADAFGQTIKGKISPVTYRPAVHKG
jgi:hypothetical protein